MTLPRPVVLWRLVHPERGRARAVVLPGSPHTTVTFFVDDVLDRAENYEEEAVALFRAEAVKRSLLTDGWQESEP